MSITAPSRRRSWTTWALARAVALALGGLAYALVRSSVYYDTSFYGQWAHGVITGTAIPYRDFRWEYPPAALPVMLLPALVAYAFTSHASTDAYDIAYGICWVIAMLGIDAWVFRFLLRRGGSGSHPAPRLWLWGLPLLGALSWSRYDLAPAAVSLAAVIAAGGAAVRRSGLLLGLGGSLKIWPLLLAPVQRTRRDGVKATVLAAIVMGGFALGTLALTGETGFAQVLHYQSKRGLQIESIAALPLVWLSHLKFPGYKTTFEFGANQIRGPGANTLAQLSTVAYFVGLALLMLAQWRLTRRAVSGPDVALVSVAFMMITLVANKVFSPQYLLWLMGVLAAACLLDPGYWQRYVPWVLAVDVLTLVEFPWRYSDVLQDRLLGVFALTFRDIIVIGILVAVIRRVVSRLREPGEIAAPLPDPHPVPGEV